MAHFLAAGGCLAVIPLLWRSKLETGACVDLTPSMHWPDPVIFAGAENERGPVLVTVEYLVKPDGRTRFLALLGLLEAERRRDGSYEWGVFEDTAVEGRFLETFLSDTWLEHLRQHQRVTKADRAVQDAIAQLDKRKLPKVTHFIAAEPTDAEG
jgi:quinol monooxygenase YgiN